MPFKANADRRQRIPKQKHKVTNSLGALLRSWGEYGASLRQRGSSTVWFSGDAVASWRAKPRATQGGQRIASALAILAALTLRTVLRLALRQTEGLIGSILRLIGLDLAVPDHSTLSRRAETLDTPGPQTNTSSEPVHLLVDSAGLKLCGAGEWLLEKHGTKTRRSWRKPHIGVDAGTGQVLASLLTSHGADDGAQVGPLLDQVANPIASFTSDGAHDQDAIVTSVAERHPEAAIIVPPRSNAVPSEMAGTAPMQRDRHLQHIAEHGRMAWQKASGCNKRVRAETAMARHKQVTGDGPRSRTGERRAAEVAVAAYALNRTLELGRPNSVRVA